MAEKNFNNSWNPLNYSQNLCVVSNNGLTSEANNESADTLATSLRTNLMVDSFSSLDLQNNENDGINQLVNDLIESNDNDYRLDCIQNFNKSHSINPFISDNMMTNTVSNAMDCGDFGNGIESSNKSNLNTFSMNGNPFNSLIGSQSDYNNNSFHLITNPDLMSSQSYSDIKSFPQQIRSSNQLTQQLSGRMCDNTHNNLMTNPMANPLISSMNDSMAKVLSNSTTNLMSNPMTNQLSSSLSSGFSQTNSNQSVVQSLMTSKCIPLQYNQKQNYQKMPSLEVSAHELTQMGSRQLRSIRARNSSQTAEPLNKLNYYLDKSYEQFKHLEKERKKIECELIQVFVGHKISSANNIPIQRLPQNASKVDRIITDMSREHAKVITIVAKMEQLKGRELNELIHNSIHKWYEIIRDLQMKRKIEVQRNATNNGGIGSSEELFIGQFCEIMRQLLSSIRAVRTCLWCALVVTLYDQNIA